MMKMEVRTTTDMNDSIIGSTATDASALLTIVAKLIGRAYCRKYDEYKLGLCTPLSGDEKEMTSLQLRCIRLLDESPVASLPVTTLIRAGNDFSMISIDLDHVPI